MNFRVMEDVGDPTFDTPYLGAGMDRNWEKRWEVIGELMAELMATALINDSTH